MPALSRAEDDASVTTPQEDLWDSLRILAKFRGISTISAKLSRRSASKSLISALHAGADPHVNGENKQTPFLFACEHGMAEEILSMLKATGGDGFADFDLDYVEICCDAYYDSAEVVGSHWNDTVATILDGVLAQADYHQSFAELGLVNQN